MKNTLSKQCFERACQKLPGGVNSPVRSFRAVGMSPLFIRAASGSRITDMDGNSFIDYVGSWGPMILGHAHPAVIGAVQTAAESGLSFGAPTHAETELAEIISEMTGMEMLRLVSSGTEAAMSVIRLARAYTGKDKIIKFSGCYHGHADYLLAKAGSGVSTFSLPDSAGVPADFTRNTLLAEFNDLRSVQDAVDQNHGEVAAIIIEPIPGNMGMLLPHGSFLADLRSLCDREGILLIFDEVMSGFRVARGGAQEIFHVQPDLALYGKIVGGGMPLACFGGSREIMSHMAPLGSVYQAGTLSGNPVSVAAGLSTLQILREEDPYAELGRKSHLLTSRIQELADRFAIPLSTNAVGGMFGLFFRSKVPQNFGEVCAADTQRFPRIFRALLAKGVYLAPSAFEANFLSSAHSEEDIEQTCRAFAQVFEECAYAEA